MRIYTYERYSGSDIRELSGFIEAVRHACDCATALCESELECTKARQDALQDIIGMMLNRLWTNGILSADQLQLIMNDSITIVEE